VPRTKDLNTKILRNSELAKLKNKEEEKKIEKKIENKIKKKEESEEQLLKEFIETGSEEKMMKEEGSHYLEKQRIRKSHKEKEQEGEDTGTVLKEPSSLHSLHESVPPINQELDLRNKIKNEEKLKDLPIVMEDTYALFKRELAAFHFFPNLPPKDTTLLYNKHSNIILSLTF
jgi:hypothetical protein